MNEKAVATREAGAIVPAWTDEQVALIKRTVAKDTTDDELALFLHAAKRSGLDPLAKQIHCVKRKGGIAIQTAIDGYRLIADRTGAYVGNDDPVFDDEKNPKKASVTVYKLVAGVRCAFTASARWDQYYPGDAQGWAWKKMPHVMLGKCAEALALRKAFPAEMSGIYTNEEMAQAENGTPAMTIAKPQEKPAAKPALPSDDSTKDIETISGEIVPGDEAAGTAQELEDAEPPKTPAECISEKQGKRAYAIWKIAKKPDAQVRRYLKEKYGYTSTRELKVGAEYDGFVVWCENPATTEAK